MSNYGQYLVKIQRITASKGRMKFTNKSIAVVILFAVILLAVGACGGSDSPDHTAPTHTPRISGDGMADSTALSYVSGTIEIDGSSTVFPITEAIAEEFGNLTGGDVRVLVGISGTGGGFSKFCNGETEITNASRPVKPSEVERCAAEGIEFVEVPVAVDGLSVAVNPDNEFVDCLTISQLETMWSEAAEGNVNRWNQVRADWPDERMRLYGPGVDSGTFDYFTEVANGEAQSSRGDFISSENDNVLVQGVSGDKNSIGYFGYSYYHENRDKLKVVGIDGGNGCVEPTAQTINDGSYAPFSRPLFLYIRIDEAAKPEILEFMRFFFSEEGSQLVTEVGYVPLPVETRTLALARFEAGTAGTLFGGDNPQKGPVAEVLEANQ
jgi:phosphate transport system substrate-binding protein